MTRYLFLFLVVTLLQPVTALRAGEPDSGQSTLPVSAKVLGGTDTLPGSWPWMTALLYAAEPDLYRAQYCGGVLVGASWVLTAAHCVDFANPADIEVAVGARDLDNFTGPRQAVSAIFVHPDYDTTRLVNDIALLQLATPSGREPVTIFSGSARDETPASLLDETVTLLGWGLYNTTSYPYYPTILQQVTLPVVSNAICSSIYGLPLAGSQLCAGYASGKDACRGDSGGPLLAWVDDQWVHAGLVSYGSNCLQTNGFYGVYTRTSAFVDFITSHVPDARLTTNTRGLPWLLLLIN